MGPHPDVAAIRVAVRRTLSGLGDGPVLVACSGGADSLALLSAGVFEARHCDAYVVGVTVDHGLQDGSAERAAALVARMAGMGVDETAAVRVTVDPQGQGLEAAARDARYAALEEQAERFGAAAVLLGHTRDDQAESVLLGLTRGSGGRSIAGMPAGFGPFRRPLLGVTRAQTESACRAQGLEFWVDPQNADPRFTRARLRHRVMPTLEEELGPGVADALARTAEQLQEDVAALDAWAVSAHREVCTETGLAVAAVRSLPDAVRRRVLRLAAVGAGSPPGELFRVHVMAVDDLLLDPRGRQGVDLPGHLRAVVADGELRFRQGPGPGGPGAVAG